MNYIYDVLLNFKNKLYDFYDWNINDDIVHIRKIPLLKIDNKSLSDLKNNKIKISNELLAKIRDKTEVFSSKKIIIFDYTCLFCDGLEVIGIVFNTNGESCYKSKLLLDEECEVIEVCERLSNSINNYEVIESEGNDEFKTRKEKEIDEYIKEQIMTLSFEDNLDKLKYLYYECFNRKADDKEKILHDINGELKNNWHKIALKLYDFFKLTSINK